jgi:hypothetical protein
MVNKGQDITPNYTCVEEERNDTVVEKFELPKLFAQIANKLTESKVQNSFGWINNSSDTQ